MITVREAVDVLIKAGEDRVTCNIRRGEAIGLALAEEIDDANDFMQIAEAGLQDWNYHLLSEIIAALRRGDFKRNGRTVTVTLPEYMGDN